MGFQMIEKLLKSNKRNSIYRHLKLAWTVNVHVCIHVKGGVTCPSSNIKYNFVFEVCHVLKHGTLIGGGPHIVLERGGVVSIMTPYGWTKLFTGTL